LSTGFVEHFFGAVDDVMTGESLELAGDIVGAVTGTAVIRAARRPKDLVARAFYIGVRDRFKTCGLGAPKNADLADLALIGGLERGSFDSARESWRKKRKKLVAESQALGLLLSLVRFATGP